MVYIAAQSEYLIVLSIFLYNPTAYNMPQRFGAESQQEDTMNATFPWNEIFHNYPEGQSRTSSGETNGRGTGRPSIGGSRPDAFHSSNYSVNPALLHQQPLHPSAVVDPSQSQYRSTLVAALGAPRQVPPQAVFFAAGVEGNTTTERSLNAYSLSNLPTLAPAWPSSSQIVTRRPSAQRRSHASGSAVDRSDPRHTSHLSSSISMQGSHHNPTSVVEHPQRRTGRRASRRLSPSSVSAPATSTSTRFHPYAAFGVFIEARHGQSSFASLSSPEPVGLQSTPPPQGAHLKLSHQEYASRSDLIRNEPWFKNQTEEPAITEKDEFVKREYVSTTAKTRFTAFVGINPKTRRAVCRIPHEITVKGDSSPCTYEMANLKEAIAHVSVYFGYKGYKCQSTEPGHPDPCQKRFPTRERRNDHQSKANKLPDARIDCTLCNKSTLERNMGRHRRRCKGPTETQ